MNKIILGIVCILSIKVVINLAKLLQCKRIQKKYNKWLKNPTWDLIEYKSRIQKLWKDAGVKDCSLPLVEPVGLGQVMTASFSVMNSFPNLRNDSVNLTISMFHEAIGTYRTRMLETLNPLFWIEFIFQIPRKILVYIGVSDKSIGVRIIEIIYWTSATILVFYTIYRNEINSIVK